MFNKAPAVFVCAKFSVLAAMLAFAASGTSLAQVAPPSSTGATDIAGKVYRVGWLREGSLPIPDPFWDAMRESGWVEGRNIKIEVRYADNADQLPALAAELMRLNVDLIITTGTRAAQAAKEASKTIPIVFYLANDPVESGLVASLARPGGNITGFVLGRYDEKMLEILKQALPRVSRVAYLYRGSNAAVLRAGGLLGLQIQAIEVQGSEDYGRVFAAARRAGADAALIPNLAFFGYDLERIAAEAARNRLPTIGFDRAFAESGGLMSYGPPRSEQWPRVVAQVDRILRGAKPRDLPVEQPTKFELVINLKTAKALGLTIPPPLLLRADEVIQ
jgi:putative ABC transport system substrate-binding protein